MKRKGNCILGIMLALSSIFMFSCEKESETYYDKLVRIEIPTNGNSTTSSEWSRNIPGYNLSDFSKEDYRNVDSIVFVSTMRSDYVGNIYNSAKCIVELMNMTDTVAIENSLIESKSVVLDYFYSKNIYNSLPSKRIDLGIRIRSEIEGIPVFYGYSYLYIYRH